MTDDHTTLTTAEAIDEQLVAYLDGELDDAAAAHVERRLADDATFRARLVQLQQAWDMLDTLGPADADESFTHSTMAMVAVKAQEDATAQNQMVRTRRWLAWAGASALTLAAACAGYVLVRSQLEQPNRELVRDLPVIERVDDYRAIESVEFLQRLEKEGLFAAEVEDVR
ncbi:MAG: hypothetical protein WD872_12535 [Pirellulaceae bacterium]